MRQETTIPALDGLRGFSCLIVLFAHMRYPGWLVTASAYGKLGVMLFFSLSGFLMAQHYMPDRSSLRYWLAFAARRILRIYPAFLATLALLYLIGKAASADFFAKYTGDAVIGHILMRDAYDVYWSILPEIKYYLLFPVLSVCVCLCQMRLRKYIVGALWLVSFYFTTTAENNSVQLVDYLSFFLSGMLAAILHKDITVQQRPSPIWNILLLASLVMFFTAVPRLFPLANDHEVWKFSPFFSTLAGLLILSACHTSGMLLWILQHSASRFIGRISYSIYLLHMLVLEGFRLDPQQHAAYFLINLVIVVTLSYLMYRGIELPGNRLGKYLARRIDPV